MGPSTETRAPADWPLIVNPHWLAARVDEPDLLIVDTRPSEEYGTEHLPGAVSWDTFLKYHWADTSVDGMRTFVQLVERTLGGIGVGPGTGVVVYDASSGYRAARALWLLRWLGHARSALLDGGLEAWKRAGHQAVTQPRVAPPARFSAAPQPAETATADDVLRLMIQRDGLVLDVRSTDEYTGAHRRAVRGGHVPGAVHLNWVENLDTEGRFKPPQELARLYEAAGVTPDRTIVTYCHGAYRAAHTWIALKLLGYPRVSTYVGSWQEWGDRLDLPVEQG